VFSINELHEVTLSPARYLARLWQWNSAEFQDRELSHGSGELDQGNMRYETVAIGIDGRERAQGSGARFAANFMSLDKRFIFFEMGKDISCNFGRRTNVRQS